MITTVQPMLDQAGKPMKPWLARALIKAYKAQPEFFGSSVPNDPEFFVPPPPRATLAEVRQQATDFIARTSPLRSRRMRVEQTSSSPSSLVEPPTPAETPRPPLAPSDPRQTAATLATLRPWRERLGLSQAKLATLAGICDASLSTLERGKPGTATVYDKVVNALRAAAASSVDVTARHSPGASEEEPQREPPPTEAMLPRDPPWNPPSLNVPNNESLPGGAGYWLDKAAAQGLSGTTVDELRRRLKVLQQQVAAIKLILGEA